MSGINVNITNNLALIVGLIAKENPDRAIEITWNSGSPEFEWIITATDGTHDTVYVADDETGHWAPVTVSEQERLDRGEPIFG
jgi:hypothetical protein